MDTRRAQSRRKPPKQARSPDALEQARTCASKLVAGAGQRFESARRLYNFPAKPVKTENPRCSSRGHCQQYVSSRLYRKASSLALACYKWLQATAGGVGASSGMDHLSDVPGFRWVWHRRKGSPECREIEYCELRTNGVLGSSRKAPAPHLWISLAEMGCLRVFSDFPQTFLIKPIGRARPYSGP